jgi:hypothetical protein
MIRCIVYSNESGSREGVYFTEDIDLDARDCIPSDCTIDHDFMISDIFPSSFPFDYNLERR